jgi:hypothetical protein
MGFGVVRGMVFNEDVGDSRLGGGPTLGFAGFIAVDDPADKKDDSDENKNARD